MKRKAKNKSNNKKNYVGGYIKVILIFVVTIFVILLLRNWYLSGVNYQLNTPIIGNVLVQEINTEEVYNYIRENENAILYVGVVNDQNCRKFEEEFQNVVTERQLENSITYLNLTKESNVTKFIKEFNKFYDTDLLGYPSLVIFQDGKVLDVLTVSTGGTLSKEKAIEFLDRHQKRIMDVN